MPISSAAFLPPSPLLIPDIGKENSQILAKTYQAYQEFANYLKEDEAELIVIISNYNPINSEKICLNISPELKINLEDFGHVAYNKTFDPALNLTAAIHREIGSHRQIRLISNNDLDYGSAVPLYLLGDSLKKFKVLTIYTNASITTQTHYEMGQQIREILQNRPEKIALIAVGTLSHRSTKTNNNTKHNRFDHRIIECLQDNESGLEKILKIDQKTIDEIQDNSLNQIAMLRGIIANNYQAHTLAYQNEFGIGYLSMYFDLQVAQI